MITPLLAAAVALAVGLPIFALGERARKRQEGRLRDHRTTFIQKDAS